MHTSEAVSILTHYFRQVYEEAGLEWTSDNSADIHGMIETIVDVAVGAAVTKAVAKVSDRLTDIINGAIYE